MMSIMRQICLFDGLTDDEFRACIEVITLNIRAYEKGDLIDGIFEQKNAIGIVIEGKINAMKYLISGKTMLLRSFSKKDIFGAGGVFKEKDAKLSFMEVMSHSKIVLISEEDLFRLFEQKKVLKNYLIFTNSKLHYLNQKIDVISQSSSKDRLLIYIYEQWLISNKQMLFQIPMSKSKLSEYLGICRASLYRTLDDLKKEGVLEIEGKNIKLYMDLNNYFSSE
ncbi:Crp/Fnr family transcriptional regulator [Fusibacter sp. 3D3]|uniref:Crp/Fnr family transcriptional regulator n=1 Tax=Fusibacter sp. 3D3 TaxID=1048380 RepID=UPI0008535E3B|nr:Crp/Fnr family transcriptional regulator [Fusibacter sp. 3D3]GAU78867.1 Hcp transcriptional regulator HcpR [Fusibacter sp. 3D3]